MKLTLLLQLAGALQLSLLAAGATMTKAVNMRSHLATLPLFLRQLFWVYFGFIGLVLVSFGLITLTQAEALASGTSLARAFCGSLAVFWLARLGAAFFVFDVRPYLTNWFYRLGYHTTSLVFIYLTIIYGLATLRPLGTN
jgi:hypothetical protein